MQKVLLILGGIALAGGMITVLLAATGGTGSNGLALGVASAAAGIVAMFIVRRRTAEEKRPEAPGASRA